MKPSSTTRLAVTGAIALALSLASGACTLVSSGTPDPVRPPRPARTNADGVPFNLDDVPDAFPVQEVKTRSGNPARYEVFGEEYRVMDTSEGYSERGLASWYGEEFHGRRMSGGGPFDMYAMTAAHRTLPLPTYVRVTNLENGRSVVVKVMDRGPFHDTDQRIIDVSYVAAYKLRMIGAGTVRVRVEALPPAALDRSSGGGDG